jgi:Asp-tRNA(Asn)/Glu-tRNA(Gln) amidotransferase B subunit
LAKRRSRVLNYLVGEVMKLEPRANPQRVRDIILGKLETSS